MIQLVCCVKRLTVETYATIRKVLRALQLIDTACAGRVQGQPESYLSPARLVERCLRPKVGGEEGAG